MKRLDIREMTTVDLQERLETEITNYEQLVINHSVNPIENPSQIKYKRRDIARMKTELHLRDLNNN